MSPLEIRTSSEAEKTVRGVCQDMARRLVSHPQGTCPVDVTRGLIALCRTQTCGKCVPCRIGLAQIESLLDSVLEGTATEADLARIEALAENVRISADCAIGTQAAEMALTGVRAFREDYELHAEGRCLCTSDHPVPCVQGCPANVDIPGYIALVKAGRFDDAPGAVAHADVPLDGALGKRLGKSPKHGAGSGWEPQRDGVNVRRRAAQINGNQFAERFGKQRERGHDQRRKPTRRQILNVCICEAR